MAISFTFHGPNRAKDGTGFAADALGPSIGNAVAVADGTASAALAASGWYRIKATSASKIKFGTGVTNGDNGELWDEGEKEVRHLTEGTKIGVSAG